jgi:hypothetical protein
MPAPLARPARGDRRRLRASTTRSDIGASWEPDVFGRLRLGVRARRPASRPVLADLAAARLAAQGELAVNYFGLRQPTRKSALLERTLGLRAQLRITRNRYDRRHRRPHRRAAGRDAAGQRAQPTCWGWSAARPVRARHRGAGRQGAGQLQPAAAGELDGPRARRAARRAVDAAAAPPDIAAAERAWRRPMRRSASPARLLPELRLTGSIGTGASRIGDLFKASSLVWSLGLSAGADDLRRRRHQRPVDGAAPLGAGSARYRQTVLTAFQDVEDQLVACACCSPAGPAPGGSRAADLVEQQVLNRYQAGRWLHRSGHRAGRRLQCAPRAGAGADRPAAGGGGADPGAGRRLARAWPRFLRD